MAFDTKSPVTSLDELGKPFTRVSSSPGEGASDSVAQSPPKELNCPNGNFRGDQKLTAAIGDTDDLPVVGSKGEDSNFHWISASSTDRSRVAVAADVFI